MSSLSEMEKGLDLNERINLRGLVEDWARITAERHQGDLEKKLYGFRTSKKGVQRSLLGSRYRFGKKKSRTNALRNNWRSSVSGTDGNLGAQYSFLLYGRFVDMGVGKGTTYALSKYQGNKRNGEPRTRTPVRWYSRRKGYEIHRLRELMAEHYVTIPIHALENALTAKIALTL